MTLVSMTRTKLPHESRATACCKSVRAKRGVAWSQVFEVEIARKCSMRRWMAGPSERFFRVISQIGRGRRSPSAFNHFKPQVCAFCIRIGACMTGMKRPVGSNFVLCGNVAALALTSGNRDLRAPRIQPAEKLPAASQPAPCCPERATSASTRRSRNFTRLPIRWSQSGRESSGFPIGITEYPASAVEGSCPE